MEFCPNCGKVLFPTNNKFSCECGYEKNVTETDKKDYEVSEVVDAEETIIVTDGNVKTLPTVKMICPKCGHNEAFWWLQQTRRADEAETRFLRCTKCEYTWREYD